jgi:ferredoxin-type protein NapH
MTWLRRSTQLLTLIVVNLGFTPIFKVGVPCPVFYCYGCPWATFACPIGVFQTYAALGPFSALNAFPFYAIGLLGLFALVFGRFWCGWACPFGTIQDVVAWARRRRPDFIEMPRFPWTGFAVLIGALILAWIATDNLFCKVCPAGSLFAAIPQRFVNPDLDFGTFFYVHLGTLAISVVAFVLIGRFWCRYLCPLGIGIFGIFNRVSFLKVSPDMDKCSGCGKCMEVCPVKIAEPEDIENSLDCIRCGKCVEACPTNAIRISSAIRRRAS